MPDLVYDDLHVFTPTDGRLGRHVLHDPRSRAYAAVAPPQLPTKPVMHHRYVPIFDQGSVGSCTANAALGLLCTGATNLGKVFVEADAVDLYELETRLDNSEIPGSYPPVDTGSTGLWSMKALKIRGLIRGYRHLFSTRSALAMLAVQPLSVGVGWYEGMFEPDRNGLVRLSGQVDGGHQVCFDGIDPTRQLVRFANSWAASWGDHGWGWLSYSDFDRLLREGGDVVTAVI